MSPLGASTDASFRWTSGVGSGLELQFNGEPIYIHVQRTRKESS
jgi:hypothetical protein